MWLCASAYKERPPPVCSGGAGVRGEGASQQKEAWVGYRKGEGGRGRASDLWTDPPSSQIEGRWRKKKGGGRMEAPFRASLPPSSQS